MGVVTTIQIQMTVWIERYLVEDEVKNVSGENEEKMLNLYQLFI